MKGYCPSPRSGLAIGLSTLQQRACLSIISCLSSSCLLLLQAMPTTSLSSKNSLSPYQQLTANQSCSLISYPLSIVNFFVSAGLVYIYITKEKKFPNWAPGIRATLPVTIFFMLSNLYLAIAPYVPPSAGQNVYEELPYYLHCVVALGLFAAGAIYYLVWAVLLPWYGGYVLVKESVVDADGWSQSVFTRLPLAQTVRS